jgi:hypothetical protein
LLLLGIERVLLLSDVAYNCTRTRVLLLSDERFLLLSDEEVLLLSDERVLLLSVVAYARATERWRTLSYVYIYIYIYIYI